MSGPTIDPTARVTPGAELADDVEVGPYCVVGPRVEIGSACRLDSHVVIDGPTRIGAGCRFFPFSSIGSVPQDLKYRGEETRLEIGPDNTVREFVTVNLGTAGGGGITRIGKGNFLMAYAHVAHDCQIGDGTILANAATLAGHVIVESGATVGAFSGVHQFCRVGQQAFIGGYSVVTRDALPFVKTVGNRARAFGINVIGLQRSGVPEERIAGLKRAYRILFRSKLTTAEAIERIRAEVRGIPEVDSLIAFIGGYSVVTRDALPFVKTVGNRARAFGINVIGLQRSGVPEERIAGLKRAYRILFRSKLTTAEAIERIRAEVRGIPEVDSLIAFICSSERGVVR